MSSLKKDDTPGRDELLWLAYRFVSDELSADEAEAFTMRLAEDQAAREAVAQAVELNATLHAAMKLPSTQPAAPTAQPAAERSAAMTGSRWSQRLAWMAVGTAACLAAMLIGPSLLEDGDERETAVLSIDGSATSPALGDSQPPSSELAMLWASWNGGAGADVAATGAAWSSPSSTDPEAASADAGGLPSTWDSEEVELTVDAVTESRVEEVPSWLVTAVSLDLGERMPEDAAPASQEN